MTKDAEEFVHVTEKEEPSADHPWLTLAFLKRRVGSLCVRVQRARYAANGAILSPLEAPYSFTLGRWTGGRFRQHVRPFIEAKETLEVERFKGLSALFNAASDLVRADYEANVRRMSGALHSSIAERKEARA